MNLSMSSIVSVHFFPFCFCIGWRWRSPTSPRFIHHSRCHWQECYPGEWWSAGEDGACCRNKREWQGSWQFAVQGCGCGYPVLIICYLVLLFFIVLYRRMGPLNRLRNDSLVCQFTRRRMIQTRGLRLSKEHLAIVGTSNPRLTEDRTPLSASLMSPLMWIIWLFLWIFWHHGRPTPPVGSWNRRVFIYWRLPISQLHSYSKS